MIKVASGWKDYEIIATGDGKNSNVGENFIFFVPTLR